MGKNVTLPPLGETLRRNRLERGLSLYEAAAGLGIPARSLRAIEWARADLLPSPDDAERIERDYAVFLGLDAAPGPPVKAIENAEEVEPPAEPSEPPAGWIERYGQPLAAVVIGIAVAVGVFLLLSELA